MTVVFDKRKKIKSNNVKESLSEAESQVNSEKIENLSERVLDDIMENRSFNALLSSANSENIKEKQEARKKIKDELLRLVKSYVKIPEMEITFPLDEERVVNEMSDNLWGFSKVTSLVESKNITDIVIVGYKKIYYKENNVNKASDIKFRSQSEYKRFIKNITIRNKVNVSDVSAQRVFTDKKSNEDFRLRISVSGEITTCDDEAFCVIRKHPKVKYTWDELEKNGLITRKQREYLSGVMRANTGMIIGGAPGSCKTTLLNNLIDELPENIFGECYQESDELYSDKRPSIRFKRVVEPSVEGNVGYSLEDYGRFGLVSTVEAMIYGEVKGNEAQYILKGTYTGVPPYLTIHANSAEETLENLVNYIVLATGYKADMVRKMLLSLSTIVYMENKKVVSILKLSGLDDVGNFKYEKVDVDMEVTA